jgi:hypothetical protein
MTQAVTIQIDPDATYSKSALAEVLGVSPRQLQRWLRGRNRKLPQPFYIGRRPMWRGRTLLAWMDRKQAEAAI